MQSLQPKQPAEATGPFVLRKTVIKIYLSGGSRESSNYLSLLPSTSLCRRNIKRRRTGRRMLQTETTDGMERGERETATTATTTARVSQKEEGGVHQLRWSKKKKKGGLRRLLPPPSFPRARTHFCASKDRARSAIFLEQQEEKKKKKEPTPPHKKQMVVGLPILLQLLCARHARPEQQRRLSPPHVCVCVCLCLPIYLPPPPPPDSFIRMLLHTTLQQGSVIMAS